jgi:AraC-like DNA-binding protein
MAYMTALMDAAGVPREQSAQLMTELGLQKDAGSRLSESEFSMLYRSLAVALDDEMLHFFSRPLRPGALKYTCLAVLDAKTLMVALHRWAWIYRVVQDDVSLQIATRGDTVRISIAQAPGAGHVRPFATDLLLKLLHGVASWLTGQRLPLLRVDFRFPRPEFAADYDVLYPGPVFFDQAQPALLMDAALLDLPIRKTRQQLDDFLVRAPEDWVFARPRKAGLLSLRLRDHFAAQLPRPVNAEVAADALAVSLRTLHRHLADEGTSFQRVKDEFRRDRAMLLLTTTALPISDIGEQLGFDSVASFHRAFRGWTGHTPGVFRSREAGTS